MRELLLLQALWSSSNTLLVKVAMKNQLVDNKLLGEIENDPSKSNSPSNADISPSKKRTHGGGSIYQRTITKNNKEYQQAYYHWKENGKKRTKYIPKKLLQVIEQAVTAKRPIMSILRLLGEISDSPSNLDNSPSKTISPSKIRCKGEGSGSIHWRIITKNWKDYPQAYYHYEFWSGGNCQVKSSRYIPKRLLPQIQQLDSMKAPVRDILKILGVAF